jgi:hypothetical protein
VQAVLHQPKANSLTPLNDAITTGLQDGGSSYKLHPE